MINIHSLLSWYATAGVYSVSKAALWSATNALRLELNPEGVHVLGIHVGWVDTAMASHMTDPKLPPKVLVSRVFDALQVGEYEVLADERSEHIKARLSASIEELYPQLKNTTV